MRKLKYFIVLIIVIIVALLFVPNSPLLRPFVKHLKSKMEENWKCKIEDTKTDFDLLKGKIRSENLDIKTVRNTDISWHLKIKGVTVDIDYSSLIHGNLILNELILDDVFLEIDKKQSKKIHTQSQKTQDKPEKAILITHLLIRGSFEVNYRLDSILSESIRVKNVKIKKKDIFLVGTPKDLLFPLMKETTNRRKFVIDRHGSEIGLKKGGRITISEEITDPAMKARGLKKGDVFVDE